ncbi:MAG: penicillin-binding protein [Candidatus Komeilibacteria bacterium]
MPIPQLKIKSPRHWEKNSDKPKKKRNSGHRKPSPKNKPSSRSQQPRLPKKNTLALGSLWKKSWRPLLRWGVRLIILGLLVLVGAFVYYSKDLPNPNKIIERNIAQSTKIYDKTGTNLLYEIAGDQKRTLIELSAIPTYSIQATIAVEDKNFYDHGGISFTGIIRSIIVDILRGGKVQGGSTLTQQLVKNAILTPEKKISRKIKELVLSYRIEKKFSKDEILKMYFNEIPYGSNAYGIEAAANYYFGKSAADLTLAESAVLAALPQAPSYYSPYGSNRNALITRQHYVLNQMAGQGYITKEQAEQAKQESLSFKDRLTNITAPHFVLYVKEYLANKYGDQLVEQGGLKIITTLDLKAQIAAENAINEQADTNERYQASNAALVAIDVPTGQILAMVGSKDYFNDNIDGQVNVAVQPRQPGSSFKPLVYLTGFTRGYTPDSLLFDLNTSFRAEPKSYEPKNYDLAEHGPVSIRQALAGSLNIPAVKMIYLANIGNVLDLADNFGYTTLNDRSRFGLSLVLGGGEVKLLEHVNAYAALAREGVWLPYYSLLKVEDANGNTLEEYKENKGEKIIDANYVRMLNDVLSDNGARAYVFGTNNYLTLPERPVAAKTGTTDNYRDAWTVGFTPNQVAAGVWVGNNNNDEMKRGAAGGVVAAPIWQKFLSAYLENAPIKTFTKPQYTNANKPMIGGYLEGGDKIKIDKISGKLATEYTPAETTEEKTFKEIHNILEYVDRADPLGPAPSSPGQDYQYDAWEDPVRTWTEKQNFIAESPPTEYDDIHLPGDKPYISIIEPREGTTIKSGQVVITVNAGAPRGAQEVKFYLDDKLIGSSTNSPFNYTYIISPAIANGPHVLSAKVYDDVLNNNLASINLVFDREEYIKMNWLSPSSGTTLTTSDFPFVLELGLENPDIIRQIDFYYRLADNSQSHWLGFVKQPLTNPITLTWDNKPNNGVYKVYPVFTDVQGNVVQGKNITASIE